MKHFALLAALTLALCSNLFAASGGVSEGDQYWIGWKRFDMNVPNVQELTGNITLNKSSKLVQLLDPAGGHRNVTLPDVVISKGVTFYFKNTANAAENLVIKNAGGTTIVTIGQDQSGHAWSDGVTWYGDAFSAASSGFLTADGSVAGATGEAQDFGTNGIKADVIAESTGAAGVTADGVLLKDAGVVATNIDAGASGTAGTLDIFPTTASKGKIAITATANTNNDTLSITNAAHGQATTLTIPDGGQATASFVLTEGSQTIAGTKTFSASLAGDGQARYIEVSVTNAEILDLADTPKTLISAPGAGKVIEVEAVTFLFDYTAAYTAGGGDDLDVCYTSESNVILTGEATGFLDATADDCLFTTRVADYAPAKSVAENAAVVLANNGTDFGGGDAGNAVRVKIRYRIWSTGF